MTTQEYLEIQGLKMMKADLLWLIYRFKLEIYRNVKITSMEHNNEIYDKSQGAYLDWLDAFCPENEEIL